MYALVVSLSVLVRWVGATMLVAVVVVGCQNTHPISA